MPFIFFSLGVFVSFSFGCCLSWRFIFFGLFIQKNSKVLLDIFQNKCIHFSKLIFGPKHLFSNFLLQCRERDHFYIKLYYLLKNSKKKLLFNLCIQNFSLQPGQFIAFFFLTNSFLTDILISDKNKINLA